MNNESRRNKIFTLLCQQKEPISATSLAKELSVSRQIIVGDIALLRASGHAILATPRGYVLQNENTGNPTYRIACIHSVKDTEKELQIFVDNGCTVVDVIVDHPIYGQLTGALHISNRYDISQFLQKVEEESAHALSELSDGVHLHTIACPSQEAYTRVLTQLKDAGFLFNQDI